MPLILGRPKHRPLDVTLCFLILDYRRRLIDNGFYQGFVRAVPAVGGQTAVYGSQFLRKENGFMSSRIDNESRTEGMNPLTKDRFDVASKVVAIIGGLISASILILTLHASTEQRARELRWNQAKLAMELEDGMLKDPQAFNALNMTDWENKEYTVEGNKVVISSKEVQQALDVNNNFNLPPNGVFIRESFDRLFFHLGKMERSIQSNLIRFEDVRSPIDYYVRFLRSKYGEGLINYMKQLNHTDAMKFMNRFAS